jgi:hypothetical protein
MHDEARACHLIRDEVIRRDAGGIEYQLMPADTLGPAATIAHVLHAAPGVYRKLLRRLIRH